MSYQPQRYWPRIYVCAPYADYELVRRVHKRLAMAEYTPSSSWAVVACGPESLDNLTQEERETLIKENDHQLLNSDAVIAIARPGAGGEMFCEVTRALIHGIPVLWAGRKILSTFRRGVTYYDSVIGAIGALNEVIR